MTSQELSSLLDTANIDELKSVMEISKTALFLTDAVSYVTGRPKYAREIRDARQYNPKQHDVFEQFVRKDKVVSGQDDSIDPNGNVTTRSIPESIVPVARLALAEQKKITLLAAAFLGSPSFDCNPNEGLEADFFSIFNAVGEDNKLDFKFKDIAKRTMSERECAELWYTQDAEDGYWDGLPMKSDQKLRVRILSPSLGDTLYPVFDEYGDMIAFGRYYETVITGGGSASDRTAHLDVYTATQFLYYEKTTGLWAPTGATKNTLKKIPVIYYSQPTTEWNDVQELIDRLETLISNHADTNDYNGSPIVVAKGKVTGFAMKGETGKLIEADEGADVKYLTYDQAPESVKLEIDNLLMFINKYTHTPDISFESIKGLGAFSGVALKMFFMDAHLKASDKEELFGQGIQRRINYLKAAIAALDNRYTVALRLLIKPVFTYFLPRNETEEIANIIAAYNAGLISLRTALAQLPLISDPVAELELIKKEQAEAAALVPKPISVPASGNPVEN